MKKLCTTILFFIGLSLAHAQIKILPKFINRMYFNNDSTKHNSFVVIPILTSAPETGIEAGGSGLFSFYSDTAKGSATRVSNIFGYATATTKGQNRFSLSTNYWTPNNTWHFMAAASYINFPFDFYGIGNDTREIDKELVDEKRFKFNFNAERLIAKNLYAGFVSGAFKYNYAHVDTTAGHFGAEPTVQQISGGSSIFIGPSLIYDSRNNNTYTTRGLIVTAYYNVMHGIFTNNGYEGGFFNIEYSQFFLLNKQLVLGLDIQEQSLTGGSSPFYLLPEMGSDEMMRGYYNGRYRDRNFIAGQAELRYRFCSRVAIVGFIGTGEVAHEGFSVNTLKPDYGGGVRYFFDIQKGLSIRADYGIGEKVAGEQRQSGFYIGLGEAF
jgi:hypothetical protein